MLTVRCQCGATYQLEDTAAGRTTRCPRCQATLDLSASSPVPPSQATTPLQSTPSDSPSTEFNDEVAHGSDPLDRLLDVVTRKRGHVRRDPNRDQEHDKPDEPYTLVEEPTPDRGYGQSLYWTLLFPTYPANLATFVMFWLVLALGQSLAPFIVLTILVRCWYAGFQFSVLESATAGDGNLPDVHYSADFYEELFSPLVKWVGSWLIALLPAIGYYAYARYALIPLQINWSMIGLGGPTGLVRGCVNEPLLLVLVCAGLGLWPMIVLSVSLGGIREPWHLGRMLNVIFRSFSAYVTTLMIVVACIAGNTVLAILIGQKVSVGKSTAGWTLVGNVILRQVLLAGTRLYLDIVMLRAIGLYYHHFKHKFDFEWG